MKGYREHTPANTRRATARSAVLALGLLAILAPYGARGSLPVSMDPAYCSIPGFIESGTNVIPNVMIILDNSGSMENEAYLSTDDNVFNPNRSYYGYFVSDKCYRYGSNKFIPGPATTGQWECPDPTYPFSGNFMNWAYMLRSEVARMVLVGGRWNGANSRIDGDTGERMAPHAYCVDPSPYTDLAPGQGVRLNRTGDQIWLRRMSSCNPAQQGETGIGTTYCNATHCVNEASSVDGARYRIHYDGEPFGVLQQMADQARWGLAIFNTDQGGKIVRNHDENFTALINDIRTINPSTWTPSGETLYEVMRYHEFQGVNPYYFTNDYNKNTIQNDPWYDKDIGEYVPCRKSFVLMITDGKPTQDRDFPTTDSRTGASLLNYAGLGSGALPDNTNPYKNVDGTDWPHPAVPPSWSDPTNIGQDNGSKYIIDIAYWANTNDLRPAGTPGEIDGFQNVPTFLVFAFGDTSETGYERSALWTMWNAAIAGGFEDKDGNMQPNLQNEWDEDGDGWPDNFFLAEDGSDVEEAIRKAVAAILARTSAGTNPAVRPQGREGEGTILQAYFNPELADGITSVTWMGFLRALWLDKRFNLREDAQSRYRLVREEDRIIEYAIDVTEGKTFVELYEDSNGDYLKDDPAHPVDRLDINELASIFEVAGELLHTRDPNTRFIYTITEPAWTRPSGAKMWGDPSAHAYPTRVDFTEANADLFRNLLGAAPAPSTEAEYLIRYIRGEDVPGWRGRTITWNGVRDVWKLGDIMHSDPIPVGPPSSQFAAAKGDETYLAFKEAYRDRPWVAYVGANDGMLHAFYMGHVSNTNDPSTPEFEDSRLTAFAPSWPAQDPRTGTIPQFGEELWGFIPHNALPHLKWLKTKDYCHTYYVDGDPQPRDVRIFPHSSKHPYGWGTILMFSVDRGCKNITTGTFTYRPSIVILDITDPFDPQVVMEYTDEYLGFTNSPAIVRIGATNGATALESEEECWYAVFGSGASDYDDSSSQYARFYAIQLGAASGAPAPALPDMRYAGCPDSWSAERVRLPSTGSECGGSGCTSGSTTSLFEHMTRTSAFDLDDNFTVDVLYFGTTVDASGDTWDGRRLRVVTDQQFDANTWRISAMYDAPGPFNSAGVNAIPIIKEKPWVVDGTGIFERLDHANYKEQQAIYGVRDDCWNADNTKPGFFGDLSSPECQPINVNNDLIDTFDCVLEFNSAGEIVFGGACAFNDLNDLVTALASKQGWRLEFPLSGERMLTPPVPMANTTLFTTYVPDTASVCNAGGDSYLYIIDTDTGISFQKPAFVGAGIQRATAFGNKAIIGGSSGDLNIESNPYLSGPIRGFTTILHPMRLR